MSEDLISRKAVQDLISSKLTDGHLQMGDSPLIDADELMDDVSDLTAAVEQQVKEKAIINELQEKIKKAQRLIVKNPADSLDEIANDTAEDFISAYKECLELIQGGKE
jgi:hypothetical protein